MRPVIETEDKEAGTEGKGPPAWVRPGHHWPKRTFLRRAMRRLNTFNIRKSKFCLKNLNRLCRQHATDELTLVIHSEDVDYKPFFPNAYTVTKRPTVPADLHVDDHYRGVSEIPDASYNLILCTGLLEHIPDPQRLIDEFHRILRPGGKLVLSGSAVFSFHESPNNFYHFTHYGMRLFFDRWTRLETEGASGPFETIGILLQRINLQSEVFFLVRPLVELLAHAVKLLDYAVVRQYDTRGSNPDRLTDSMMPSNIYVVAIK